jgi:hypothetical protein
MFNVAKITLFFDLGAFSYKNNIKKGAFSYKNSLKKDAFSYFLIL